MRREPGPLRESGTRWLPPWTLTRCELQFVEPAIKEKGENLKPEYILTARN